jgi:hypothetical protein
MSSRPSANKIGVTFVIVISLSQFGQISMVGTTERVSLVLMTPPSTQRMSGRTKRFTLARVAVSLKGKRWKLARSLCDSGSIANTLHLLPARVEEKRHPALITLDCASSIAQS